MPPVDDPTSPPGRTHGGLTTEERRADRRRRLLDAGLERFGTRGYTGTTIREICAMAGVTERHLYEQFASLEALLLGVYEEIIAESTAAVAGALEAQPTEPDALVRAGLNAFVHTMAYDDRRLRVNFIEVVGAGPVVEERRREAIAGFAALTQWHLRALQERGFAPERDRSVLIDALVGATQGALVGWVERPPAERAPLDEVIEELTRLYLLALSTA